MIFQHFDTDGVYRVFTRGGHKFEIVVSDMGEDYVVGRRVSIKRLKTKMPDGSTEDYVTGQNRIRIDFEAIDAKESLGGLHRFQGAEE